MLLPRFEASDAMDQLQDGATKYWLYLRLAYIDFTGERAVNMVSVGAGTKIDSAAKAGSLGTIPWATIKKLVPPMPRAPS